MARFRKYSGGGLEEALKTVINVTSLEDIYIYYTQETPEISVENLTCEPYGTEEDHRIPEWGRTYIIKATVDGITVPIGWSNEVLT